LPHPGGSCYTYGMPRWTLQIKTDYAKYQRQLKRVQGAFAETMARTMNITAHAVDNKSHRNLQSSMILRNQYTERSLRVSEARVKKSGGTGYAEVGSVSPYLPLQETGGVRRPVRGSRVPVPTRTARGGDWRRPVLRRFALKPGVAIGRPGRRTGSKMFILRPGPTLQKPAIFMRPSRRKLIKVRLLHERSYRVRPTRWHSSAVKQFGKQILMQQVFNREAKKRLGIIR